MRSVVMPIRCHSAHASTLDPRFVDACQNPSNSGEYFGACLSAGGTTGFLSPSFIVWLGWDGEGWEVERPLSAG